MTMGYAIMLFGWVPFIILVLLLMRIVHVAETRGKRNV